MWVCCLDPCEDGDGGGEDHDGDADRDNQRLEHPPALAHVLAAELEVDGGGEDQGQGHGAQGADDGREVV